MKFSWTFVWSSNLHPLPPLLPSVRHSHVMPGQAAAGGIRGQMMCWSALRLLRHRALRTGGYWPNLLCGILITYYLLLYFVRRYYKAYNQIQIPYIMTVLHWLCQNMFLFSFELKIVGLRPFQIFMSSLLCEFCLSEADIVIVVLLTLPCWCQCQCHN